jgi:hypothetical protein
MVLGLLLLEEVQWSWNENIGKAGNFYSALLRGSYFIAMLHLILK